MTRPEPPPFTITPASQPTIAPITMVMSNPYQKPPDAISSSILASLSLPRAGPQVKSAATAKRERAA